MIAVRYYDEENEKLITSILEVIEQSQTKSDILFTSTSFLSQKKIGLKNIISLTTDNAKDMTGSQNGLITKLKTIESNLFNITCICPGINLILVNLFRSLSKKDNIEELDDISDNYGEIDDDDDDDEYIYDIEQFKIQKFVNGIASYFNFSYKRHNDYSKFSKNYLQTKKESKLSNPMLYLDIKEFRKFERYSDTRWLSLGESLKILVEQWYCLDAFFEDQLMNKKLLKLKKQE